MVSYLSLKSNRSFSIWFLDIADTYRLCYNVKNRFGNAVPEIPERKERYTRIAL